MSVIIKKVENAKEWEQTLDLRYKVFVEEQGVPEELERDEKDPEALHVIAREDSRVIGCGRLVFFEEKCKIGRVAVAEAERGRGLGSRICKKLIEIARENGYSHIILHAQLHTQEFYEKLGFQPVGEIFEEAGIDHIKMEYVKESP